VGLEDLPPYPGSKRLFGLAIGAGVTSHSWYWVVGLDDLPSSRLSPKRVFGSGRKGLGERVDIVELVWQ
jgi:hypothetical protein